MSVLDIIVPGSARTAPTTSTVSLLHRGSRRGPAAQPCGPNDDVTERAIADGLAAVGDDHERISRRNIGPPSWQGEQHTVQVVEMDPVLTPVPPVRDELEVLAEQRMEPVRHPNTSPHVHASAASASCPWSDPANATTSDSFTAPTKLSKLAHMTTGGSHSRLTWATSGTSFWRTPRAGPDS